MIKDGQISPESRCSNPARWEIVGQSEPVVHSCDKHLAILLEDEGSNTVINLFAKITTQ